MKYSFKEYIAFLFEGGNLTGPNGETCSPISTKNRHEVAGHVIDSLSALHDSFHAATGHHLFGKNKKALQTGSAFSGSSAHLVNPGISDEELHKHKPTMGDIDTQIPKEHLSALHAHLQPGKKFGKYTVVSTKKHGNETSAIMRHEDTGDHHQIDFEGVDYHKEEPTKFEQFAHSSNWEDTKNGIKGSSHKQLLNAAGGAGKKFSITHGLNDRTDDKKAKSVSGIKDEDGISKGLFGKKYPISSFDDVAHAIKKHTPADQHASVIEKFSAQPKQNPVAVHRLKHILGHNINESADTHHAHITFMGASPCTHVGHKTDVIDPMLAHHGDSNHVGLSGKSEVFSPEERAQITKDQVGSNVDVHNAKSIGETTGRALSAATASGKKKKVLHIHVGEDRKDFAERFKESLQAGKIKEMGSDSWDEVHIHTPEDKVRSHGMSGTKLRKSAFEGNTKALKKHLGAAYTVAREKTITDHYNAHPEQLIRK